MSRLIAILIGVVLSCGAVAAQDLTALARVDAERSALTDRAGGVDLRLGLSQPVPFRVFTLDAPWRLVADFSEVDWRGLDAARFNEAEQVSAVAMGVYRPGWSRMVLMLDAPLAIESAEMRTIAEAEMVVRLAPVTPERFSTLSGAPEHAAFDLPEAEPLAPAVRRQTGEGPLVVALDPGHGGIDPGAERGGAAEADLMLLFARELREVLLRAGGFEVVLTREADIFVPLERRQSIAREAGADVFISLHADALSEGRAQGATIYTLSDEASDLASQKLAERHDRGDLLAGVDLSDQDDEVARLLMALVRAETAPRSDRLADALVDGLRAQIGNLHKRPRLFGAFSVLKAPDIPAVLIELGFMSSKTDLANLLDPDWRARAAIGIRDALQVWAREDAAEALLLRQ